MWHSPSFGEITPPNWKSYKNIYHFGFSSSKKKMATNLAIASIMKASIGWKYQQSSSLITPSDLSATHNSLHDRIKTTWSEESNHWSISIDSFNYLRHYLKDLFIKFTFRSIEISTYGCFFDICLKKSLSNGLFNNSMLHTWFHKAKLQVSIQFPILKSGHSNCPL